MKTRSTLFLAVGSAALITTVSLAGCKTDTAAAAPAAAKAGEGSCGADKKAGEGSCGADKKKDGDDKKAGEGSCGEGSCGSAPK